MHAQVYVLDKYLVHLEPYQHCLMGLNVSLFELIFVARQVKVTQQ